MHRPRRWRRCWREAIATATATATATAPAAARCPFPPVPPRRLGLTVAKLQQRRRVVQVAEAHEAVLHAQAAGPRPLPGRAAPPTPPPITPTLSRSFARRPGGRGGRTRSGGGRGPFPWQPRARCRRRRRRRTRRPLRPLGGGLGRGRGWAGQERGGVIDRYDPAPFSPSPSPPCTACSAWLGRTRAGPCKATPLADQFAHCLSAV